MEETNQARTDVEEVDTSTVQVSKKAIFLVVGLIAVIVVGFFVLRSLGNNSGIGATGATTAGLGYAPEGSTGSTGTTGLSAGNLAPDFQLVNFETGEKINRDSFKGKPTLIHFFAYWCPRCSYTANNVAPYDDATGGNAFNVLLVSIDSSATDADILSFKQRYGRSDWVLAKLNGKIEQDYNVRYLDTKYLLDENGVIRHTDFKTWDYNEAQNFIGSVLS